MLCYHYVVFSVVNIVMETLLLCYVEVLCVYLVLFNYNSIPKYSLSNLYIVLQLLMSVFNL